MRLWKRLHENKVNSDDYLPLKKPLKFCLMTITIRSVFEEDGKLYPQVFLDDALYELNIWKTLVMFYKFFLYIYIYIYIYTFFLVYIKMSEITDLTYNKKNET